MGGCCYMDLGKAYWSIVGSDRIRTEVLDFCFDAFSSREPVSTSLESALTRISHTILGYRLIQAADFCLVFIGRT